MLEVRSQGGDHIAVLAALDAVENFTGIAPDQHLWLQSSIAGADRAIEPRVWTVDEFVRCTGRRRGLVEKAAEAILLATKGEKPAETIGDHPVRLVTSFVTLGALNT